MVRLKVLDVNLDKQNFKLLIKKGSQQREELRAIKNIALDFWKEQLKGSSPGLIRSDFSLQGKYYWYLF